MRGPPLDVLGELCERFRERRVGVHGVVPISADGDQLIVAVADLLLALLGDAKKKPNGSHWHDHTEIGDEVEVLGVAQRIECA
jgi:hypothetical protein